MDDQTAWTVGLLAFRYSHKAGRINIEHIKTLETATIRIAERKCTSDDVDFIENALKGDSYICQKWQFECDMTKLALGDIRLHFRNINMEIIFHVLDPVMGNIDEKKKKRNKNAAITSQVVQYKMT